LMKSRFSPFCSPSYTNFSQAFKALRGHHPRVETLRSVRMYKKTFQVFVMVDG
jgi:hypothetical protein